MEAALASLAAHAEDAIRQGRNILILSDRSVVARHAADPGAARDRRGARAPGEEGHAHAHRPRRRDRLGARGAPLRAARRLRRRGDPSVPRARDARRAGRVDAASSTPKEAQKRFIKAICKGLYKVMSKMGISTYQSYCGAQIFEAVGPAQGVRRQVLHRHGEQHRGHRPVRGRRRKRQRLHALAFGDDPSLADMLDAGGEYAYRVQRRRAHVDAGLDREAAARGAREQLRDLRGIRDAHQRAGPQAQDAARPVRVPARRRAAAGAARRGRAGDGHRAGASRPAR